MIPNKEGSSLSKKGACIPMSSNCIIWDGPDLPCINLCNGDVVTDVIYKLAEKLCDLVTYTKIDGTTINMHCLLTSANVPPVTLKETIQALIVKACATSSSSTPGTSTPITVNLPTCLVYNDTQGQPVTALNIDEYAMLLANKICSLTTSYNSLSTTVAQHTNQIAYIMANCCSTTVVDPVVPDILVELKTNVIGAVGTSLPIVEAFGDLETNYAEHKTLVGSNTKLTQAINAQPSSLSTDLALSKDGKSISELNALFEKVPTSAADSIANLWITIADVREYLYTLKTKTLTTCALVPPYNVSILGITATTCTIGFSAHNSKTLDAPESFVITVFNYDEISETAVGDAIANVGGSSLGITTSKILNTSSLDSSKKYLVKVVATYSCGESVPVQVVGYLKQCIANYKIHIDSTADGTVATTCNGTSYLNNKRLLTISLTDSTETYKVNNTKKTPITFRIKLTVTDCNISNDVYEYYDITIPTNSSTATLSYLSGEYHYCNTAANCQKILRGNSGTRISIENVSDCDVVAGYITYSEI